MSGKVLEFRLRGCDEPTDVPQALGLTPPRNQGQVLGTSLRAESGTSAEPDTTAADMDATQRVHYWLRDLLMLADTKQMLADQAAAIRDHVIAELKARNRRSITFPDVVAEFRSVSEPWCVCHNANVTVCPKAKTGERVPCYIQQMEPRLVVHEPYR